MIRVGDAVAVAGGEAAAAAAAMDGPAPVSAKVVSAASGSVTVVSVQHGAAEHGLAHAHAPAAAPAPPPPPPQQQPPPPPPAHAPVTVPAPASAPGAGPASNGTENAAKPLHMTKAKSVLPGLLLQDGDEDDEDLSGSDGEVSKIDFTGVNLRNKKKRVVGEVEVQDGLEEPERPMSWEGELSDAEMSIITSNIKDHEETSMEGVQICGVVNDHADSKPHNFEDSMMCVRPKQLPHQPPPAALAGPGGAVVGGPELPLLVDKLLGYGSGTPSHSPVLPQRHQHPHTLPKASTLPPTPSPDSAIHSAYSYSSPAQSPLTSRHGSSHGSSHGLPSSGFSSPYTPSLSRNNSDASQYGGSQHSSCYSYSSVSVSPTQFSPTHSPIQSRHMSHGVSASFPSPVLPRTSQVVGSNGMLYGGITPALSRADEHDGSSTDATDDRDSNHSILDDKMSSLAADFVQHSNLAAPPGISRQQLINSPCPICGDKISGFHYGIFSCESCKGFFKRTVQNRKNYVCLRGSSCPVTIATRKKCPACRFEKCLKMGMKLEAIREDRTRGGRSTYQCSYTLPAGLVGSAESAGAGSWLLASGDPQVKLEALDGSTVANNGGTPNANIHTHAHGRHIPQLLQDIMDVEHLWYYNDQDIQKLASHNSNNNNSSSSSSSSSSVSSASSSSSSKSNNSSNLSSSNNSSGSTASSNSNSTNSSSSSSANNNSDFISNLCNIADHRLYRLVKWCKSLPLFKNISIDDQISLLINAWCELLLFSCCFRSMATPGEIRVSLGKSISLAQARELGLGACIERMLNFTEHLRRLRVDKYEYVAMKVIVLLTSDASDLKESEKVRASQEKALQALQHYTLAHYPDIPSKFGELLLRIPELQRTCQVGKEMLSVKNKEGEGPSFNLLMELLRGDH